ncbi:MAG: hypothetical protein SGI88_09570 [Candidatus Hydrogenedentes bacterium]|nr:hypothetical protein [Candidatus Hydrogenedentota bacterium]
MSCLFAFVQIIGVACAQTQAPAHLPQVKPKMMRYAHYDVASKIKDSEALGGFWISPNVSQKFDESIKKLTEALDPKNLTTIAQPVPGTTDADQMEIMVANGTQSIKSLSAQDSCIPLVQEAKDTTGQWRPIEFRKQATCGNSYHTVFLEPGQFWKLDAPQNSGPIKTSLRYALTTKDGVVYSREFSGSIQDTQFIMPIPRDITAATDSVEKR